MIVPGRLRCFAQIVPLPRAKVCAFCYIDKWVDLWYNISVKRESTVKVSSKITREGNLKNFSKFFQKPLDKTIKVWYNIYVR